MPIKSRQGGAILAACVLAQGTASAKGFCEEGIEKKLANVEMALSNIRKTIPAVRPESADYFAHEYGSAVPSGSSARMAALERQPYFNEWRVLKSLANAEMAARILKDGPTSSSVHPFASIPQTRIYWASQMLLQLPSLEREMAQYVDIQRRSLQPMVTEQNLYTLTTTTFAFPLTQIIECELDNVTQKSGPILKTYPR